jgi:hypothetical protein
MKTHCLHGHEMTENNTVLRKNGCKECRECCRLRDKNRYPREKEKRIAQATQWNKDHKELHAISVAKQEAKPRTKIMRQDYYERTKGTVRRRFVMLRSTAKKLKRDMTLTESDYEILVSQNICLYCGGSLPKVGCGLDRQNNKMGYVHGNVVPCCHHCNERKGSLEGLGFIYPRSVELLAEILENDKTNLILARAPRINN